MRRGDLAFLGSLAGWILPSLDVSLPFFFLYSSFLEAWHGKYRKEGELEVENGLLPQVWILSHVTLAARVGWYS